MTAAARGKIITNASYLLALLLLAVLGAVATPAVGDDNLSVPLLLAEFRAVDWDSRAQLKKSDPADEAWRIRARTEHALILLEAEAVRDLVRALEDTDRHVRALAACCLGAIGDPVVRPPLTQRLGRDADNTVRLYAAEALGRLGDAEARTALQAATGDQSPHVALAARVALERLVNGPQAGTTLRDAAHRARDFDSLATPQIGQAAPEIDLPSEGGEQVRLSSFRGRQPVVVMFQLADW